MITKHADDVRVDPVTVEGVERTEIQWLLSKDDGAPNFALRRFTMKQGGSIPLHGHPWEHEIYILSGRARAFTETDSREVGAGDVLYIPPDEPHGYEVLGEEDLLFLCVVPSHAS